MKRPRKLIPMLDREYVADDYYLTELGQRLRSLRTRSGVAGDWFNEHQL